MSDDAAYALMIQAYDRRRVPRDPRLLLCLPALAVEGGRSRAVPGGGAADDGAADGFYEAVAGKLQRSSTTAWAVRGRIRCRARTTRTAAGVGEPWPTGTRADGATCRHASGSSPSRWWPSASRSRPCSRVPRPHRRRAARRATAARSWWRRRSSRSRSPRLPLRWRRHHGRRSRSSAEGGDLVQVLSLSIPYDHDGRGDLDGGGDTTMTSIRRPHAAVVVEAALSWPYSPPVRRSSSRA